MSNNDILDDYLGELLLEVAPAAAAVAIAKPAADIPGDTPELEAAFEAALAEIEAAKTPRATPIAPGDSDELQAIFDDAQAAANAASKGREPTWDDLPDEVIYEAGAAESATLAHSDSPALHAAFEVAAGRPEPIAPSASSASVSAARPVASAARPVSWQELQAQAQRPPTPTAHQRRASERASRWLRLRCGRQTYALELLKVQEVVLPVPLLALRGTAEEMLGIMNLRGQVVPVMDLCTHLGMTSTSEDGQTRIVVLEENGETLGLRVSAVEDVASLTDSQIEPPDTARICQISNELFRGVARLGAQPMILLDATRLLQ
ncbi:MAG: chemotaxis protein CheW [Stenotrophomonas sp.]